MILIRLSVVLVIFAPVMAGATSCGETDSSRGDGEQGGPEKYFVGAASPHLDRRLTVGCEGIRPAAGWRAQATAVSTPTQTFGLLVRRLRHQAYRLPNGQTGVKAGAIIEGPGAVTLRVPAAHGREVALFYGDAAAERGPLSAGAREITFEPCRHQRRSGWAGGFVFESEPQPLTLRVHFRDGSRLLRLMP